MKPYPFRLLALSAAVAAVSFGVMTQPLFAADSPAPAAGTVAPRARPPRGARRSTSPSATSTHSSSPTAAGGTIRPSRR